MQNLRYQEIEKIYTYVLESFIYRPRNLISQCIMKVFVCEILSIFPGINNKVGILIIDG